MPCPPIPDERLSRKADGRESRLCFTGHVLMETKAGLPQMLPSRVPTRTAEREGLC
jgi:hypothetical protein